MKTKDEILGNLPYFRCTSQWYKHPLYPGLTYTDGVRYLADAAGCYWLIDYIFSNQLDEKVRNTPFQVWKLKVEGDEGHIQVEDGNYNIVKNFDVIEYTDFPLEEITLWFVDKVLLLPSEY